MPQSSTMEKTENTKKCSHINYFSLGPVLFSTSPASWLGLTVLLLKLFWTKSLSCEFCGGLVKRVLHGIHEIWECCKRLLDGELVTASHICILPLSVPLYIIYMCITSKRFKAEFSTAADFLQTLGFPCVFA